MFAKGCTPNWSEEVFVIKKVKYTRPWINVIEDLNGKQIFGTWYEKELKKESTRNWSIQREKVVIRLIVGLIKKDIAT